MPSARALAGLLCLVLTPIAGVAQPRAANFVAGELVTLTSTAAAPNGAWCWFQDERVVVDARDPQRRLLLASTVSSAPAGDPACGDIDLLWLDLDTGEQGTFELADQLECDDHNCAALWIRPDGRYVAAYGRHGSDPWMRSRVSLRPGDPTAWAPEERLEASGAAEGGATYNNLHYLKDDRGGAGRLYNFTRSANWDPNVIVSDNAGADWTYGGKLLTVGTAADRPYVKYASDGRAIHFLATEGHPRNRDTSVYHGVVRDGQLFDATGLLVDGHLFDDDGAAIERLTQVFAAGTSLAGAALHRCWPTDLEIDGAGRPVAVFTARADDDDQDHRFCYATLTDAGWRTFPLAKAGGHLYPAENDYTGLAALDPDDPAIVYVSTPIDPRTEMRLAHYEIFRGETPDAGRTWQWTPITYASDVDNLRPSVPRWNREATALVWLRGTYDTYRSWSTDVVALIQSKPLGAP